MKSVLISIKPKWCNLIANGKKTIEIRKNRPKLETPFKCYIYCTHGYYRTPKEREMSGDFWVGKPINDVSLGRYWGNGKVIGEFVCNAIDEYEMEGYSPAEDVYQSISTVETYDGEEEMHTIATNEDCCLENDLFKKSGLSFDDIGKYVCKGKFGFYRFHGWHISELQIYDTPKALDELGMTRPPQSWCYIYE